LKPPEIARWPAGQVAVTFVPGELAGTVVALPVITVRREREGVTYSDVEVSARSVEFLSPRRDPAGESVPAAAPAAQEAAESWAEIPF
jgi:hypothetical protein